MKLPRHYFQDDFLEFEPYIQSFSHQVLRYSKGDRLFADLHFSTRDKFYFYIQQGFAMAHGTTEKDDCKIICYYGKASFSCIDMDPFIYNTYSIIHMAALSDTTVLLFDYDTMMQMLEGSFPLCLQMINFSGEMIAMLSYQSVTLPFLSAEVKLCEFLYLSYLFYPSQEPRDRPETLYISQLQMAQYIGVSRVQVTRVIRALKEEGIIDTHRGAVTILKVEKLKAKCSACVNIPTR